MKKPALALMAGIVGLAFSSPAWADSVKFQIKGAY